MSLDQILLVRHDITGANYGYIQGQSNSPLQPGFGLRVDRLTDIIAEKEQFQNGVPIHIISSPLGRTYGTAQRMLDRLWRRRHYLAELRYSEHLKERGQGDLEGKSFEEALPLLSSKPSLTPDAETIYRLLYLSNNVPNAETHKAVTERLEQFVGDYIQQLQGTGIIVTHLISGMNYLRNLLTDGNILGNPPRDYQHYPNLSVVRLELDPQSYMRYTETRRYGPLNHHSEANGVLVRSK